MFASFAIEPGEQNLFESFKTRNFSEIPAEMHSITKNNVLRGF